MAAAIVPKHSNIRLCLLALTEIDIAVGTRQENLSYRANEKSFTPAGNTLNIPLSWRHAFAPGLSSLIAVDSLVISEHVKEVHP
jgi:hypothetical protein